MIDDIVRWWSVPAWLFCLGCLAPAVWRLLRGRGRSLDPIWGVVFLLSLNRLSFLFRISPAFSHASALILAIVMGAFAAWYQRNDS